jgi:hypothetical protein
MSFYCNIFLPFYLNIVCKNIVCELGLKKIGNTDKVSKILYLAKILFNAVLLKILSAIKSSNNFFSKNLLAKF